MHNAPIIHQWLLSFWENITLEMFIKFSLLYFFILWIALVVWVARDISNRTDSIVFQVICILLMILLTPLGIVIYLMIRPRTTLFEKYYHEIDENLEMFHKFIEAKAEEKKGDGEVKDEHKKKKKSTKKSKK